MKLQRHLRQLSFYKAEMLCNNTECLYRQIVSYQHSVKCSISYRIWTWSQGNRKIWKGQCLMIKWGAYRFKTKFDFIFIIQRITNHCQEKLEGTQSNKSLHISWFLNLFVIRQRFGTRKKKIFCQSLSSSHYFKDYWY